VYNGTFSSTGPTLTAHSGSGASSFWVDGATQAYDGITQSLTNLTVGDTYTVSFWLNSIDDQGTAPTDYQHLSTNGDDTTNNSNNGVLGNGYDVLVYAGGVPTLSTTPEPASLTMLGIGCIGLMGYGWRRKRRAR
jgi:hypothetical protein